MSIKDWKIDGAWTLFLDRDGVINQRIIGGYITRPEDFHFLPGAQIALARLSTRFYRKIVVTNQQGIGKGIMDERNLLDIHAYMCNEVYKTGGKIDKCYFAPNLAGAEDCLRKPGIGMAELAKLEFPEIEFSESVMVGDSDSDIQFGKNLGMKTVRIRTVEPIGIEADLTVGSLEEFAKVLENEV